MDKYESKIMDEMRADIKLILATMPTLATKVEFELLKGKVNKITVIFTTITTFLAGVYTVVSDFAKDIGSFFHG